MFTNILYNHWRSFYEFILIIKEPEGTQPEQSGLSGLLGKLIIKPEIKEGKRVILYRICYLVLRDWGKKYETGQNLDVSLKIQKGTEK